MTEEKQELVDMVADGKGLQMTSLSEMYRFAEQVHKSGLAPASLDSPAKILVAAQTGAEIGMTFMAAVKAIYVVKGTPSLLGKYAKGLVFNRGVCEEWRQGWNGEGDNHCAWVESVRKGIKGVQRTEFSVADAKRAELWGKSGQWTKGPDNMLLWRCVGRHCDQNYSDVLMGLPLAEVVKDHDWVDRTTGATEQESPSTPDPLLAQLEAPKEKGKKRPPNAKDHKKKVDKKNEPEAKEVKAEVVDEPDYAKGEAYSAFINSKYCSDIDNELQSDMEFRSLLKEFKPKKDEKDFKAGDWEKLVAYIEKTK